MAQAMRDIDCIAETMAATFTAPMFPSIEPVIRDFARAAREKVETLRTDPDIFDIWAELVAAGERLASFTPMLSAGGEHEQRVASFGTQLICNGRALIFHITRARVSMPKSTREFIDRAQRTPRRGSSPWCPSRCPPEGKLGSLQEAMVISTISSCLESRQTELSLRQRQARGRPEEGATFIGRACVGKNSDLRVVRPQNRSLIHASERSCHARGLSPRPEFRTRFPSAPVKFPAHRVADGFHLATRNERRRRIGPARSLGAVSLPWRVLMNERTALLGLLLSGFFAVACIRASVPVSPASGTFWTNLLRFPGRIERLRRSRWQWFAMVSFMIVLRLQQQLPLVLELMAAVQLLLFLVLPTRATTDGPERRNNAAAA